MTQYGWRIYIHWTSAIFYYFDPLIFLRCIYGASLLLSDVQDDNDELRCSPGTPVFTAPECCLGLTYHGKAVDTWAVGVALYCMVLGHYPFPGETLQDTYDKVRDVKLIMDKNSGRSKGVGLEDLGLLLLGGSAWLPEPGMAFSERVSQLLQAATSSTPTGLGGPTASESTALSAADGHMSTRYSSIS